MNRKRNGIALLLLAFLTSVLLTSAPSQAADSPPNNADRIRFDSQCVTVDSKDLFIFSGAFHYFRCPKELWPDRFRKLKEAGFNTIETYAAWNWHEPNPPANPDDFSKIDMTSLTEWLAMAADQFGFYIYLRPGPYICAEWDGGGYPQWLLNHRPADYAKKTWLRTDEPAYLAWCRHWFTAAARAAAPFQVTRRPVGAPGIILWQIENEYNYSDIAPDVKRRQLIFLAQLSRELGIDVPLTTCLTDHPSFRADEYLRQNVIETRNSYPKYSMTNMQRDITMLDRYQPEKFRMISELQGGWFAQVGGKLSEEQGFNDTHINHITLLAWEQGFTATNYYMLFGGTNFGDWAAASLTTTYDYDAPLREPGGVTARYLAVKALGNFLKEHGARLVRATAEKSQVKDKTDTDVSATARRATDGSRYVFVRTEHRGDTPRRGAIKLQTAAPQSVEITVNYELGPYGAKILYLPPGATSDGAGQWYPKPVDAPPRPANLPAPIVITEARTQVDPGPSASAMWKPISTGQGEEAAGIFHRGFVYYRSTIPTLQRPATPNERIALSVHPRGRDWAGFQLNGKMLRPEPRTGNITFDPAANTAGAALLGLYENAGRPNFGKEIDRLSGLPDLKFSLSSSSPRQLSQWRVKRVQPSRQPAEVTPDFDDSSWPTADANRDEGELSGAQTAVYRISIELTEAELKAAGTLSLGRVDEEGTLFVNGQMAGACSDWSQAQTFDISKWLRAGKNLIAMQVVNRTGAGGLARGAWLGADGPALPAQWELCDQPAGVVGKWWTPALDDSTWRTTTLGSTDTVVTGETAPLLSWYRMRFEMSEPSPRAWVPWKLRLDAVGNGFLYLNGHALGRWWQAGPQREFYLPECWLHFGAGKTNVLTMSLRPTEGVGVRSAQVAPYENLAEER